MENEDTDDEMTKVGEITLATGTVSLRQPREITEDDVEMLLKAYERFLKTAKSEQSSMHFR